MSKDNKPEIYFIRIKIDESTNKYYFEIDKNNRFNTLTELVKYYRQCIIKAREIPIPFLLGVGVHKNTISIDEDWYIIDKNKDECEKILKKYRKSGAFYIRTSQSVKKEVTTDKSIHVYTLTFFMNDKTYNARIYAEKENYSLKYYINNKDFKSLKEIVNYYRNYFVFRSQKLTIGLNRLLKTSNSQVVCTKQNNHENSFLNDASIMS
jgi:hypothetical protein